MNGMSLRTEEKEQALTGTINRGWISLASRLHIREETWIAIGTILVFLFLWELVARLEIVKPIFISSPSRIFNAAIWLAFHGLWKDVLVSFMEFALGFLAAVALAIPLGLLLGWYSRLNAMFDPFITALNATPRVALIPLIIVWIGIGIELKIAVVFLGAFFPLVLNVMMGVKTVDESLLSCARSFGARDRQIFSTLILPTSLPFIVAGMRLAIGRALVGVVVAELVTSTAGLGHLIYVAGATFQTDKLFVGIVILSLFGYLITEILKRLEAHFENWRPVRRTI
jgi:ABC-type nitrate/sulfonate/bicarbonate transport system permease component